MVCTLCKEHDTLGHGFGQFTMYLGFISFSYLKSPSANHICSWMGMDCSPFLLDTFFNKFFV